MRRPTPVIAAVLGAWMSLATAQPAAAEERTCRGSIGPVTVDGNLQCKENQPRPTGGGNIVHGNKEDQCARL